MKCVVPIKQVAALDDDFELQEDDGIDPADLDYDLNEWDAFSLEAAIQLRERDGEGEGEVVVVTVGDDDADEALRSCLAKGADRAVRVWDDALEGADALAVARVLAAVTSSEDPDLVLCGVQSSDAVNGATGVALAGFLDLAHVAVVRNLDVDGSQLTVERELEGGTIERIRLSTPALLTIQTGINEPRYANLRAIKQANQKPLAVQSLADLGLDEAAVQDAAGGRRRSLRLPERGEGAEMLEGAPAEVASRIVEIIKERKA